jgi:hypothetical protein
VSIIEAMLGQYTSAASLEALLLSLPHLGVVTAVHYDIAISWIIKEDCRKKYFHQDRNLGGYDRFL